MNTHRIWQRHSPWLSAVLVILGSGGCSLLYDLGTHQCNQTSDCAKLGPKFAKSVCKSEVCVAVADTGAGGSTASGGTDSEGGTESSGGTSDSGGTTSVGGTTSAGGTTDVGGSGGVAGSGATAGTSVVPTCSNAKCATDHSASWICRNNDCVNLVTDDCPVLIPQKTATTLLKQQDVIVIGGYAAMANSSNYYDSQAITNWDLVLDDFNKATLIDGLPGYAGGGTRPIVGLICSTTGATTESITRSMTHLTGTAQVPAVLSTLSSNFLYQAWMAIHPEPPPVEPIKPVFFMGTGSADLRLANLADDGLMWHMLGDPRALAAPVVALVKQMEPLINAKRAANFALTGVDDPSAEPLRVTLISSDEPIMTDIANVLVSPATVTRPGTNLIFNGLPALDNGANFNWKQIQSSRQHSTPPPDVSAAIQELAARPPHLIVAMATAEFPLSVLPSVETSWGTLAPNRIPPYYLMSHMIYNNSDLRASFKTFASTTPPLDNRVVGINYAAAQEARAKTLYDGYLGRLKSTYQGTLILDGTENHYDGAYHLLYALAAAAANRRVPDGTDIAYALTSRIISTSTDAFSVDASYQALSGADTGNGSLAKLFSEKTTYKMSLYGTMGPPDFDRFSGTRVSATSAWCVTRDSSTVWTYRADGLLFNAANLNYSPPSTGMPSCFTEYCPSLSTGVPPTCLPNF